MPYSELKPGRLRLEDETTGTAYLFIQKDDNLLWCDVSENILQVITNVKWGAKADRPTAGKKGLLYFATDTKEFFYDNGSAWVRVVSGETGLYDADRDTYIDVEPSSDADKIVGYTAGTQVLNISSAGILTFPKQSACLIGKGSNPQSTSAGVVAKVDFDTIIFDLQNEANLTNDRVTISKDGVYLIIGSATIGVCQAGDLLSINLKVNGNNVNKNYFNTGGSDWNIVSISVIRQLSAGDYIELFATNNDRDSTIEPSLATTYLGVIKIA